MTTPVQAVIKIKKWMKDHNLARANLDNGFLSAVDYDNPDLLLVLDYKHSGLKYLFDSAYGGGSKHLLKDFDEEVLQPLGLHMERFKRYYVGLFLD